MEQRKVYCHPSVFVYTVFLQTIIVWGSPQRGQEGLYPEAQEPKGIKVRQQETQPILLGQGHIGGYQIPVRITHMYYIPLNS